MSTPKHHFPFAHLSGIRGEFVEFSVDGYQFPEVPATKRYEHDANWLYVVFRVSDGIRTWGVRDPAWLTTDLPSLSSWLRSVAKGEHPENWTALEPLLTLCAGEEPRRVTARLALELRSDDARMSDDWDQPIELAPTVEQLNNAADVVDMALERLPVR